MGFHGRLHPPGRQVFDARITRQTDDIANAVPLAPGQDAPAAEAGVAAEDDAHLRPGSAQPLDQKFEDRPRMFGGIDARRPQVGHPQLFAAEDIQRQEAVVVVVAVKAPPHLIAMHRVIGGIEVEDQFGRRRGERGDEAFEQNAVDGAGRVPVGALFQPAQGRTRSASLVSANHGLQGQVVA